MIPVTRKSVSLVVWALYFAACAAPVVKGAGHVCTGFSTGTVYGFTALMAGWAPPMTLPWSANLFLLAGWVLLLWRENADAAVVLGIAAALLGLTSLIFIPSDELLVGYYLWQLSLVWFARGSFAIWRRPDSEEAEL